MAYQNVGTPRFYIDLPSYIKSLGLNIQEQQLFENYDIYGNPIVPNPNGQYTYLDAPYFGLDNVDINKNTTESIIIDNNGNERNEPIKTQFTLLDETQESRLTDFINPKKFYLGLINFKWNTDMAGEHYSPFGLSISKTSYNFGDPTPTYPNMIYSWDGNEEILTEQEYISNIVNVNNVDNKFDIEKNGVSILTGNIDGLDEWNQYKFMGLSFNVDFSSLGGISFGSYYDMPVSPDLDLSMTVEFDGYDSTNTLGGSTLTNVRYSGSPWWYDAGGNKVEPWSVGASSGFSKRNGRRMWSMKFSYMSDKDIFASNYMSNTYLETSTDYESDDLTTDNNNFEYTLENDNSFIAQVLNKVGNGQRFIFQPDNTNNNPDQFAICQLDQDSLQIKQVAYKVYDISLKIREVW